MSMLNSLSGYPEWLPEDRIVEQSMIRTIQNTFELHGFAPMETRSIEPLSVILAKGETDKEIYTLRRLQAAEDEADKGIGLHFDLTIPFSRYVLENRSRISFPFRRYQIQKAWRGERPGLGRYREFLQADIDIIDTRPLTVHSDIEVIGVISQVLQSLPIPEITIMVNNRKLLEGFYRALGIEKITEVLRIIDKLDKIGEEKVLAVLVDDTGISGDAAAKCVSFGKIRGSDPYIIRRRIMETGLSHPLLEEGITELCAVLDNSGLQGKCMADLSIARGFDYYTGTVCEGKFLQFPRYPTVVAGGRYDNLASDSGVKLPGVGVSIGLTRILGLVLHEGLIRAQRKVPSCVLVALVSEELRGKSEEVAQVLRARGIACEIYPHPLKYGKQISYADEKGIPYVWFPDEKGEGGGQVRDLRTREQAPANPQTWNPDPLIRDVAILRDEAALQHALSNSSYVR